MSRDLVVTQNTTVDGVVEATDDWFGVAGDAGNDDLDAVLAAQRDASDGFLVGRGTFEGMRDFWGPKTDDTTGVTAHLNRVQKYVLSTTLDDPGWEPRDWSTSTDCSCSRSPGAAAAGCSTAPHRCTCGWSSRPPSAAAR